MNNITIHGRLVRDPEIKTTDSGVEVCDFTVAVDRPRCNKENKKTDFFNCVAWRSSAAFINKYFHKGDGIIISGHMFSDPYDDKDGKKVYPWKLQVENTEFPMGKGNASASGNTPKFEETDGSEGTLPF